MYITPTWIRDMFFLAIGAIYEQKENRSMSLKFLRSSGYKHSLVFRLATSVPQLTPQPLYFFLRAPICVRISNDKLTSIRNILALVPNLFTKWVFHEVERFQTWMKVLKRGSRGFDALNTALDESTSARYNDRYATFLRNKDIGFHVTGKLLDLMHSWRWTTGTHIASALKGGFTVLGGCGRSWLFWQPTTRHQFWSAKVGLTHACGRISRFFVSPISLTVVHCEPNKETLCSMSVHMKGIMKLGCRSQFNSCESAKPPSVILSRGGWHWALRNIVPHWGAMVESWRIAQMAFWY